MKIALVDSDQYSAASPFPHCIVENFLPEELAIELSEKFPDLEEINSKRYADPNQRKFSLETFDSLDKSYHFLGEMLSDKDFLKSLQDMIGSSEELFYDESLRGGGCHQSKEGGFLGMHIDFNKHTEHKDWDRRVNLIIFLNKEWESNWGGELVLANKDGSERVIVKPEFNKAVFFSTTQDSWHGVPNPVANQGKVARNTLAFYYYSYGRSDGYGGIDAHTTKFDGHDANIYRKLYVLLHYVVRLLFGKKLIALLKSIFR